MAKKVVTKTITVEETKHKKVRKNSKPRAVKPQLDKVLLENFVNMQKVITEQNIKIDSLTNQISSLLSLFEISAKTIVEKQYAPELNENQKILQQIQNISEQNKIIARGLTMLHEAPRPEPIFPRPIQQPISEEEKRFESLPK